MQKTGYNKSVIDGTVRAANTPYTMVTPAENVRGIVVRKLNVQAAMPANTDRIVVLAKNAAPANVNDGVVVGMPCSINYVGSTAWWFHVINEATGILVPAGLGVYYIASGIEQGAAIHAGLFELL